MIHQVSSSHENVLHSCCFVVFSFVKVVTLLEVAFFLRDHASNASNVVPTSHLHMVTIFAYLKTHYMEWCDVHIQFMKIGQLMSAVLMILESLYEQAQSLLIGFQRRNYVLL